MKVAVTGGTGCLGKPLIKRMLMSGYDVNLLLLPQDNIDTELNGRVKIFKGNLDSINVLTNLVDGCDAVFHLAGKVHEKTKTIEDELEFYHVNVDGTKKLINSCINKKVKRFIFYSTVGVYGNKGNFHGDEQSLCNPESPYAKSKLQAEKIVMECMNNAGSIGVVLRFPVVYGPWDRGNVQKLIKALEKKIFFYFGDGKNIRSMISSENAAEAAFRAANQGLDKSDVFCVTDGRDYSFKELINEICNSLNTTWRPWHISPFSSKAIGSIGDFIKKTTGLNVPIDSETVSKLSKSLTFSCEKAERILDYKPVENLSEGLDREVKWIFQR